MGARARARTDARTDARNRCQLGLDLVGINFADVSLFAAPISGVKLRFCEACLCVRSGEGINAARDNSELRISLLAIADARMRGRTRARNQCQLRPNRVGINFADVSLFATR